MATAGATAALAGLVFVAISINIERILGLEGVADLGLVTLLLLVGVLIISMFGLIPGQAERAFGIELIVFSVLWSITIFRFMIRSLAGVGEGQGRIVSRILMPLFGVVPCLAGALLLLVGADSAMYLVFAGMVGAILAAVLNAWVLLVEILR